jgi:hypothetical protein
VTTASPATAVRVPPSQFVVAFGIGATKTPDGKLSVNVNAVVDAALAVLSIVKIKD